MPGAGGGRPVEFKLTRGTFWGEIPAFYLAEGGGYTHVVS